MIIFILEGSLNYESHVLGAYSTRIRAEQEQAIFLDSNPDNNGSRIYEILLDQ